MCALCAPECVPWRAVMSGDVSSFREFAQEKLASQAYPSWNQITAWLESLKLLQDATGWAA